MNQLSNVSLYDVKAYVRKAQNAVLNFSDMEAKVREATNNEPWGVPTSTMQQIADATQQYQPFHEIMPFVFRRFTEKSSNEWRQILKALTLLDYLVRNGSEKVVEYSRHHITAVEMLRHFGYIDSKGVDRGQSIRKLASELGELLRDTDRLRSERKKAKQLLAKTGAGTAAVSSSYQTLGRFGGSDSRYAGVSFNSPTGDLGGFGGSGHKYGGISSDQYRAMRSNGRSGAGSSTSVSGPSSSADFEEYEVETTGPTSGSATAAAGATADDDDDFADFQSAPSSSQPAPSSNNNILDLFDTPATPATNTTPPSTTTPTTNAFSADLFSSTPSAPSSSAAPVTSSSAASSAPAPAPKTDLFDSLWETSKTSTKPSTPAAPAAPAASAASSKPAQSQSTNEVEDLLSF